MIPILKEIVEILYSKGLIKVLLATETFAMGVNMPTKSVVFTNVTKFDGHQKRIFRPEEYGQMAGRAGRRGLDTQGTVIILPFMDFITESEAKLIMLAPPQKIQSKFSIDYSLILKLLNHMIDSNNQEDTIKYLTKVLSNTLFNGQDSKQNHYLIGDKKVAVEKLENIQKFLDKNAIEKRPLYERLKQIETELKPSGFFRLDKKQEKALLKEKSSLELDMSPSTYRSIDSWVTLENQVKKITNEIEFNETKLQLHIEKIISFLEKKEMVQIDTGSTFFKLSEAHYRVTFVF
jgi:replicative superfamily II helicase